MAQPNSTTPTSTAVDESLLRLLWQSVPLPLACLDAAGRIVVSNRAFASLCAADGLPEQTIGELFASIDSLRWAQLREQLHDETPVVSCELFGATRQRARPVEMSLQALDVAGLRRYLLGVHDNRDAVQREGLQQLQTKVLQAVASGRPLHACMELLCRRVEALAPEVICSVLRIDDGKIRPCAAPSLPPAFSKAIDGVLIGPQAGSCGTAAWRGEAVEVADIASDPLWAPYRGLALPLGLAACWSSPIKLRDGRVVGTFAFYYRTPRGADAYHRAIVETAVHLCTLALEHERAQQQIHQLAFYDALTGLPNRSLLQAQVERALWALRGSGGELAIVLLDLDHFKTINDSVGHNVGDQLLQHLAERVRQYLLPGDMLGRLGGDEFLLLLPDSGEQQARQTVEGLLACLAQPFAINGSEYNLAASVGISLAPHDALDFETLHRNADLALYQAKAAGRNTYSFYQAQMNDSAQRRLQLANALRKALDNRELAVHYQPKIELSSGTLRGVEALVRWTDPQLGSLAPDSFIPVAEEVGLIGALDTYVLEEACRQIRLWQQQGLAVASVAVNLSANDFRAGGLDCRIAEVLKRVDCPAQCLILEITESLMMSDVGTMRDMMQRLRDLGVQLSVDDFGTGYSSLSYLKRFPVSELKLDRSFVNDLAEDPGDRELASAVIQLGRAFQLRVVAEGVETQQQLDILRQLGCDLVQGYLFARPMSAAQLECWLQGEGAVYLR